MSIENAERLLRFIEQDEALRSKVNEAGPENFEAVATAAGASCTAYDVVRAVLRKPGEKWQHAGDASN
ncbi:MAG: Nif11-like leader peptide family natural product precursor [Gammaproteobacteria bacterium]|nr:Nif11-like leader peptide family natural product precursor [Gammaproteobacteria bacterium]